MPGLLHFFHQPVVTSARFQCDSRTRRQATQVLPHLLPVMAYSLRCSVFALFVHRDKHRELFMGVTSDILFHIALHSFVSGVFGSTYRKRLGSAFIGSHMVKLVSCRNNS